MSNSSFEIKGATKHLWSSTFAIKGATKHSAHSSFEIKVATRHIRPGRLIQSGDADEAAGLTRSFGRHEKPATDGPGRLKPALRGRLVPLCRGNSGSPGLPIEASLPPMSIAEVRSLPLREKLQILEAIWEDLSSNVARMEISPGDRELLDSRIERVRSGETEIHDWDSVKDFLGRR